MINEIKGIKDAEEALQMHSLAKMTTFEALTLIGQIVDLAMDAQKKYHDHCEAQKQEAISKGLTSFVKVRYEHSDAGAWRALSTKLKGK